MSEYFIKFLKLAFLITFVCITWLFGGEVIDHTGIGVTVIYTVSVIACLLLGISVWIDMNGR